MPTPDIANPFFELVITIAAWALGVCIIAAVVRLVRGPKLPDRVVALDLIGYFAIGIISLFAIATGQHQLLSVSIVMALILFLGTAAFATYLERRARP